MMSWKALIAKLLGVGTGIYRKGENANETSAMV
jgi:hypothetical protein